MSRKRESFITPKEMKEAIQRGLQLKSSGVSLSEIAEMLASEFPQLERGPEGRRVMMKVKYAGSSISNGKSPFDSCNMTKVSQELFKIAALIW